jgi:hypothetical protein
VHREGDKGHEQQKGSVIHQDDTMMKNELNARHTRLSCGDCGHGEVTVDKAKETTLSVRVLGGT